MSNVLDQDWGGDESDGDDFNPGQHIGSDDEAEKNVQAGDDADDDGVGEPSRSNQNRKAGGKGGITAGSDEEGADGDENRDDDDGEELGVENDEEEDEEDEDEEDDDDDDDVEGQPSRKRRRRAPRNAFIDVEAEVDEDDEEEPEEDDEIAGDEMHPDDLQELPPGADRDDRKHRELDRQRDVADHIAAEQEAERLRERYGRQGRAAAADAAIMPQRLLLPSVDDPRIYRMKCRPGKEREIILTIHQRILERENSRDPIKILSVFERGGPMAGNLYVEAWSQEHVKPAFEGIQNVFMGTKEMMIPLEEMPDLLRTRKSKQLDPGMYVRMKRGVYAGDLAQIEEVETNGTTVVVRLLPRLDYGLNEDINAPTAGPGVNEGMKRKRPFAQRPAARVFSEHEAKKRHGRFISKNGNGWKYMGKDYVNGFLITEERVNALQTENVNPTLEEVTKFAAGSEDGTENLDLAALAATLKSSTAADFLPGDNVEIFKGEQRGVAGRAVQVYGEVVRVQVDSGPLRGQTVEAPVKELRKLFKEGDHVKVVGGSKYFDEVGMVVRIRDDRVTILTDSNQQEITVFSKDLRVATDAGGIIGGGLYDLFDLVQLDAATVGCVIKVDRESLRILDQNGSVRSMLPSNVSNKIDKRRNAVATDRDGNEMKADDTIKEISGEQRNGRVLHLHRNYVFAQNRERTDNSGVFVARHGNVQTVAAKGGRLGNQTGPDLTKMNPAMKMQNGGAPVMPPPQTKGRDRLIGKTVRVKKGPSKGLLGIVRDATDDNATVELHTKKKDIIIPKEKLAVVDPISGQQINGDARAVSGGGMRAPPAGMHSGRTPLPSGGRTPAYAAGGRTPGWAGASSGGGRTPAWKQDAGGRTPAAGGGATAYGGGFGGSTPYGGQTSYGGTTSYGGNSVWGGGGSTSAWNPNAGGRTPAAGGGRTPAYLGGLDAPTPGFNSAPTPGNFNDHPTPGGFRDQPTPGVFRGAPETPGPYSAETPAAAGDDGPTYD
ncbi:transcription elongation factor Spt5 [Polychaeton citri CBS 116435]|uniref:Transcription elongation factor SPT5 n=1 Tax=Polychaeton citri CBS 116435 TaxID=1314669 RepID=A0A9P4Q0X6_9PEZI|nr:transcription elongation factor Spt5 [Polychaeton citri CBS 116435]